MTEPLSDLISRYPGIELRPRGLLLAWSGVLTLAYQPLPACMLHLKQQLAQHLPQLKPENPGSRWPKTTLAVVADEQPLTETTARQLLDWQSRLPPLPDIWLGIEQLQDVQFACRSLESCLASQSHRLAGRMPSEGSELLEAHQQEVEQVWAASRSADHWQKLCLPGNHRHHYHQSAPGRTLIAWLPANLELAQWLDQVQQQLDQQFPGLYHWFTPASRHLTLRALDPY